MGNHVVENSYCFFGFLIIGIAQEVFDMGKVIPFHFFEILCPEDQAVRKFQMGLLFNFGRSLSLLCDNVFFLNTRLGSLKLLFFLIEQLDQLFLRK